MSTKKSWKALSGAVTEPSAPLRVEAMAVMRHVVMLSAIGNSSEATPLLSVTRFGWNSRVSGKYSRTRAGAGPETASVATPILSTTTALCSLAVAQSSFGAAAAGTAFLSSPSIPPAKPICRPSNASSMSPARRKRTPSRLKKSASTLFVGHTQIVISSPVLHFLSGPGVSTYQPWR